MPAPQPADPAPAYEVHVFCCVNQRPATHRRGCCASKGAQALADYMCRRGMVTLAQRAIRINLSGCLNMCEQGPAMVIYPEGVWYTYVDATDIDDIVNGHLIGGKVVERLLVPPHLGH